MAISDPAIRLGAVVVVPFPYADQLAEKRRPALVISGTGFNRVYSLVWVAMITSAGNEPWPDDIALPPGRTGLAAPSVIRITKIATIEQSRILRVAGHVDRPTLKSVAAAMARILK